MSLQFLRIVHLLLRPGQLPAERLEPQIERVDPLLHFSCPWWSSVSVCRPVVDPPAPAPRPCVRSRPSSWASRIRCKRKRNLGPAGTPCASRSSPVTSGGGSTPPAAAPGATGNRPRRRPPPARPPRAGPGGRRSPWRPAAAGSPTRASSCAGQVGAMLQQPNDVRGLVVREPPAAANLPARRRVGYSGRAMPPGPGESRGVSSAREWPARIQPLPSQVVGRHDFRQHGGGQPGLQQQADRVAAAGIDQHAAHLHGDPLGADGADLAGHSADRRVGLGLQREDLTSGSLCTGVPIATSARCPYLRAAIFA